MGRPKNFDTEIAVERAMGVFWRKGYAFTTPTDLTDEIGIGRGSLYNAFGSKHALFEKALQRYSDTESAVLIELLERPGPIKERLRSALRLIIEADFADGERRGCLAVNTAIELAGRDETATRMARGMFDRLEESLRQLFAEGQRSGEIGADRDPAALAGVVLSTVNGLRVLSKTAEGPDELLRIVDTTVAML